MSTTMTFTRFEHSQFELTSMVMKASMSDMKKIPRMLTGIQMWTCDYRKKKKMMQMVMIV